MNATLTPKQEAFALAYIRMGNASDAYRAIYKPKKATKKTINETASRLVKHPKVAARIAEVAEKTAEKAGLTIENTLQALARLVHSDPRKVFDAHGCLIPPGEWTDDVAAAVASIEVFEEFSGQGNARVKIGETKKLKFWDKNSAIEKAMKHLGMFEKDNSQSKTQFVVLDGADQRA